MKKINLIGIFVLMSLFLAAFSQAAVFEIGNDAEKIIVTKINQEPDPVGPGNILTIRFRIENLRSEPAKDMQIKIIPKYPFSMYGDSEIKNIGTLSANQGDSIGVREKFVLKVDEKAATGENIIEFWYKTLNSQWTKGGDYVINIKSRDAVVAINEISVEKGQIIPGTTTKVSFKLENLADNTVRDIKLKLDIMTPLVTASSITYKELPFTPIGSGNEKTLIKLEPMEGKDITFNIFTDADAISKVYKVPYTLQYSDSSGTNFTSTGIVGLLVDASPDLSVNLESTTIYSSGSKGNVVFKLVNKGFSDIKFLDVELLKGKDYAIISNPDVYVGKLDSDDYETAEYTILADKNAKDKVILPLNINYRDSNGHLYSKNISLELKLFSGEELNQRVDGKGSPLPGIIILVIIIVGVVIFLRIRKKKKQK